MCYFNIIIFIEYYPLKILINKHCKIVEKKVNNYKTCLFIVHEYAIIDILNSIVILT